MIAEEKRDVIDLMRSNGMLKYGEFIPGDEFRELFGIETINTGTLEEFRAMEVAEMSCSGFIRDMLLDEGKYLKSEKNGYRILLPSENAQQVMAYMKHADNKLKRGLKLNKNTPSEHRIPSEDEVRMTMKKESKTRF